MMVMMFVKRTAPRRAIESNCPTSQFSQQKKLSIAWRKASSPKSSSAASLSIATAITIMGKTQLLTVSDHPLRLYVSRRNRKNRRSIVPTATPRHTKTILTTTSTRKQSNGVITTMNDTPCHEHNHNHNASITTIFIVDMSKLSSSSSSPLNQHHRRHLGNRC